MEILGCPEAKIPLSVLLVRYKRVLRMTFSTSLLQELKELPDCSIEMALKTT